MIQYVRETFEGAADPLKIDIFLRRALFGTISYDAANDLLSRQGAGTYLVRFSRSSPGKLDLAYLTEDRKVHHMIITVGQQGLFIDDKMYGNLGEITQTYSEYFKTRSCFSSEYQTLKKILQTTQQAIEHIVTAKYDVMLPSNSTSAAESKQEATSPNLSRKGTKPSSSAQQRPSVSRPEPPSFAGGKKRPDLKLPGHTSQLQTLVKTPNQFQLPPVKGPGGPGQRDNTKPPSKALPQPPVKGPVGPGQTFHIKFPGKTNQFQPPIKGPGQTFKVKPPNVSEQQTQVKTPSVFGKRYEVNQ